MTSSPTLSLLAVAGLWTAGCTHELTVHNYDKPSLDALGVHSPIYRLDNNGRIIELQLENKKLDDSAFDHLAKFTAMRTLSLYGSSFNDTNLAKLHNVGQLRSLGLGATPVTDEGLLHLRALPRLRWLWITGNKTISSQARKELRRANPDLTVYE